MKDRVRIELREPEFSDFPSDITYHNIKAETSSEAWMELMYRLNRFGENVQAKKGVRRTLYDVDVNISDSSNESPEKLRRLGHDPEEFEAYQREILEPELPDGISYTYGNRLRKYFGVDQLEHMIERLERDPFDRKCLVSTWDSKKDGLSNNEDSCPCLTQLYFVQHEGKLKMTADFRTHNSIAWLKNAYGLRAIQEHVSEGCGIEPGQINLRSRWISLDLSDTKIPGFLDKVERYRKSPLNVDDPRGNFVINVIDGKIVAEHLNSSGLVLTRYEGSTAKDIKDQLRKGSVLDDPDHAMFIGYELARVQYGRDGKLEEL